MQNILDVGYRRKLIDAINSNENKSRKSDSLIESEISNGRLDQYVKEYLIQQFSEKTVREMPVVSTINIAKKIEKNLASVYMEAPERNFIDVNEQDKVILESIYNDGKFNQKLRKANRNMISQKQGLAMLIPIKGKLELRVLRPHHYDVIVDENDPETAAGYILSTFDRELMLRDDKVSATGSYGASQTYKNANDYVDNAIADEDDWKAGLNKYIFWTPKYNFTTDNNGNILSTNGMPENPTEEDLYNLFYKSGIEYMPFYDFNTGEKDFEYWVRDGSNLANFTIQFNGSLSDVSQIVRMQGWSQAYLKASAETMPENVQVGPTKILKLKINPEDNIVPEFGFASPASDINGSISFLEMLLSLFLSSEGIDPKEMSTKGETTTYSSALERFLAALEKLEATKDHYEIFKCLEDEIYQGIVNYQSVLLDTELLSDKYKTANIDASYLVLKYKKPNTNKTDDEKLQSAEKKKDLGITTRKRILMEVDGLTSEEAQAILDEVDAENNIDVNLGVITNGETGRDDSNLEEQDESRD